MYNFEPYDVLLAIATLIPVLITDWFCGPGSHIATMFNELTRIHEIASTLAVVAGSGFAMCYVTYRRPWSLLTYGLHRFTSPSSENLKIPLHTGDLHPNIMV